MRQNIITLLGVCGLMIGVFSFFGVRENIWPVKENLLKYEVSPYLLQHQNDLVWWHSWGDAAFKRAKRENKLVFVSIGYSTCYWCHYMAKNSFESPVIAGILNQHFVAIKVDREEHPDVDEIYMNALIAMRGSGGWPVSMFVTPEGKPIFGMSTIEHDVFAEILQNLSRSWAHSPASIISDAQKWHDVLEKRSQDALGKSDVQPSVFADFSRVISNQFDVQNAGLGSGQKFPQPHIWRAMLRIARRSHDPQLVLMIDQQLSAMAKGGLIDLIGGGFHRYTVDPKWEVPHFEKMLIDNAYLARLYLDAYQFTGNVEWEYVARGILDWVLNDMTQNGGGFFTAMDAGPVGQEGAFYTWTDQALSDAIPQNEWDHFRYWFQLNPIAPQLQQQVLSLNSQRPFPGILDFEFHKFKKQLSTHRQKRDSPILDDKLITAWNGSMIAAMAKAYQLFGNVKYLSAAQRAAHFIRSSMTTWDGRLVRTWRAGRQKGHAVLDDYAALIDGLIMLYQADFDPQWIRWASQLQDIQDQYFWDDESHGYFFTDGKDRLLILRTKRYSDGAHSSGNSLSFFNMLRLDDLMGTSTYKEKVTQGLSTVMPYFYKDPGQFATAILAMDYLFDHSKQIAIIGGVGRYGAHQFLNLLRRPFFPNHVVAVSMEGKPSIIGLLEGKKSVDGKVTAYVCDRESCQPPTTDLDVFLKQITSYKPLMLQAQ